MLEISGLRNVSRVLCRLLSDNGILKQLSQKSFSLSRQIFFKDLIVNVTNLLWGFVWGQFGEGEVEIGALNKEKYRVVALLLASGLSVLVGELGIDSIWFLTADFSTLIRPVLSNFLLLLLIYLIHHPFQCGGSRRLHIFCLHLEICLIQLLLLLLFTPIRFRDCFFFAEHHSTAKQKVKIFRPFFQYFFPFTDTIWDLGGPVFHHYFLGCNWMNHWFSDGTHFCHVSGGATQLTVQPTFLHILHMPGISFNFALSSITWIKNLQQAHQLYSEYSFTLPHYAKNAPIWSSVISISTSCKVRRVPRYSVCDVFVIKVLLASCFSFFFEASNMSHIAFERFAKPSVIFYNISIPLQFAGVDIRQQKEDGASWYRIQFRDSD